MANLSRALLAVLAVAVVLGANLGHAQDAQQYQGYVCDVTIYKYPNTGKHGYIDVSIYSQPHCGGTQLGTHYYCSAGATWDYCVGDSHYLLSEAELLSLRGELIDAGRAGNMVVSYGKPCKNGNTTACGAIARVFLYANR